MLCVTPSDVFQTTIIESIFYQHFYPLQPLQKTPTTELEEVVSYHHYIPLETRREETNFLKSLNRTISKNDGNKPFSSN